MSNKQQQRMERRARHRYGQEPFMGTRSRTFVLSLLILPSLCQSIFLYGCLKCVISYEEAEGENEDFITRHNAIDLSNLDGTFTCSTDETCVEHPDSTYRIRLDQSFLKKHFDDIFDLPTTFCVRDAFIDTKHGIILHKGNILPWKDAIQKWGKGSKRRNLTMESSNIRAKSFSSSQQLQEQEQEQKGEESEDIPVERMLQEQDILRNRPAFLGNRTVMVVRVFSDDSPVLISHNEVRNHFFGAGPGRKKDTITSQFEKCSAGRMDMVPLSGFEDRGLTDGVLDLDYGASSLQGADITGDFSFRNEITDRVHDLLNVDSLPEIVNHVVYILPSGVVRNGKERWSSFANWYRNYFRAERARALSATMHEMGHTLGLKHAGEGRGRYNDQTGYMGKTYRSQKGPIMCFNGAQHAQLGWFRKETRILAPETGVFNGRLLAFVDVGNFGSTPLPPNVVVILQIKNVFIQYNRAKKHNSGTREKADLVTITRWTRKNTWLLRALDEGDRVIYQGLRITFCRRLGYTEEEEEGFNNRIFTFSQNGLISAPRVPDSVHITVFPNGSRRNYCPPLLTLGRSAARAPAAAPTTANEETDDGYDDDNDNSELITTRDDFVGGAFLLGPPVWRAP